MGRVERVMPLLCITWLGLITGVVGTSPPQDCADLFAAGTCQSGTYTVGEPSPYRVYCDMSFLGGGWTVLQRRQDGSVDFAKNWADYQQGFGDLSGEFWLGLDNIHTLTTAKSNNIIQIELEDFDGGRRYARYSTFSVGDASGNYVVSISGYSGDAGNSLTSTGHRGRNNINGMMFSTMDRDNDPNIANCADNFSKGGWWYPASCGQSFLNGRYNCHQSSVSCGGSQGVVWSTWGGTSYFLKKTTIMIRPADFTAPAQFVEPVPQDEVKDVGQNVSWTCRAKGYPLPNVTWQHGGNDLMSDGSDIMITTSYGRSGNDVYTESTLTIGSVEHQHNGAYTCEASNNGASPQTFFSLTVRVTTSAPVTASKSPGEVVTSAPVTASESPVVTSAPVTASKSQGEEAPNCLGPVVVAGAAVGCFTGGLLLGGAAVFLFLRIRRAKDDGKKDVGDREYENVPRTRMASQRPGSGSYEVEYDVPMETIQPPTVRSPQPLNDDYQELRPAIYQSLQKH